MSARDDGRACGIAIRLRQLVHDALARDDMPEVIRLNKLADGAYLHLSPVDASTYLAWARQFIEPGTIGGRGDA